MKVEIENIRGCTQATFELNKIVLLMGNNGASKTSIIRPLGFVIAGLIPKQKAARQRWLKDGSSRGRVQIGGTSVEVPIDDSVTSDGALKASRYSTQLVNFADEKSEVMSAFLQTLLKTEPGQDQLNEELDKMKVSRTTAAAVWNVVEKKGWNDTLKYYEERGRDLKQQWHGIAGKTWGSVQSAKWTPKDWEPELDGKSEQTLNEELAEERTRLEGMIASEAINEERLAELQEKYLGLEPAKAAASEAKDNYLKQEKAWKELNDKLKALPRPGVPAKTLACVECGAAHVLKDGELVKAPAPVKEDKAKMLADIKELEDLSAINGPLLQAASSAVRRTELEVDNCESAHKEYIELMKKPKAQKHDEKEIDKQRALVDRCIARVQAFKLKAQADVKHEAVMSNQLIIDALQPDGFRQRHSADAIAKFNDVYLADQCKTANYPLVKLSKNLDITYGGRLYEDLSGGEQYRVNAMFQIALARIQNDNILLFDKADILDGDGRRGLFMLLSSISIPAIVGMTARKEHAPDLAAMGIGESYWLDKGVLSPLKQVAVKA